ncbi:MAG: hypothetical protein K2H85_03835 [Allobaculum sp.]|nr:hypothetical protein [Allobaculum sp.]
MPNIADGASPLRKSLPIFFLIDVSGSMYGERIAAVNEAMDKLVPQLKEFANGEPLIDFTIRVITYGNGKAIWKIGEKKSGIPLPQFDWFAISDSEVDGGTPADKALELLSTVTSNDYREYLCGYIGTPMVIIISDGESNGNTPFQVAVDKFRATKAGGRFIQVAVGIDTQNNTRATDELSYFGINGFRHCTDNPEQIVNLISTATFKSLKQASVKSIKGDTDSGNVNVFEDDIF